MKKVLFSLLMLMMASAAWAFDVTFDATVDFVPDGSTAAEYTINKECVTMHIEQGATNGSQYRFYKGKKVTFSSDCGPITRIVFTCVGEGGDQYGPAGFTSDPPEYSAMGHLGIWTNAGVYQVVFTASNFQVRATKIVVTIGGEAGMLPPRITPPSGTYYGPIEVSLDCSDEGAAIYYTLDGSEPTTESTLYTAPFTISESAIVKAVAVLDGEMSQVGYANYEIINSNQVLNIWESLLLPDGALVQFVNPVSVIYQYHNYLWLKDETGCVQCYGSVGHNYYMGDIIPGGFGGKLTTYRCVREIIQPNGFQPAVGYTTIEPEVITPREVGPSMVSHLVKLCHVRLTPVNGNTYLLTDDSGIECQVYFGTLGLPDYPIDEYSYYDITGIVSAYVQNGECVYQVLPLPFAEADPLTDPIEITPSQVGPETVGKYVVIRQVLDFPYYTGTICDLEGETCRAYMAFNPILPAVLCWSYDLIGTVEYNDDEWYGSGYCLRVTDVGALHSGLDDIADVKRIRTLYKLADDSDLSEYFDLSGRFVKPLTAVYQYDDYLYVRDMDGEYGLVLGDVDGSFNNGDLILGATAQSSYYYGKKIIVPVEPNSFELNGKTAKISPQIVSVSDLNQDMIYHYVSLKGVDLTLDGANGTIIEDSMELPLFNRFDVSITEYYGNGGGVYPDVNSDNELNIGDINYLIDRILQGKTAPEWVGGDGTYDVTGFVMVQHGKVVIYPTQIMHHGGKYVVIGDVNGDGELNIADVNCIIKIILGYYNDY